MPEITLLRINEAAARLGIRQSAFYAGVAAGLYPRPVRIGARAARVPSDEIDRVIAARVASRTDDEIRALVRALHQARATADAAE